jgi:hypothetical protein
VVDDPSPTPTTTNQDQGEATVEGEVASRREPPRRVQVAHPASWIIGDMNERTTRLRVQNNSHFAHAAFVATFEPKDTRHALSDQVWELVDPPLGCKPVGTKWVWKNKVGEKQVKACCLGVQSERGDRLRGDLCSRSSFGGDQDPSTILCC